MIQLHFDGISREWVIRYLLEGTPVRTIRTTSLDVRNQFIHEFAQHDKAVASGATFAYTGKG